MASFENKVDHLLDSAVQHKIVEKITADNLSAFARSDEYEHKGWFSLSSAMGGLGALVVCFGVILIIATNWYMFSDLTKITAFLILLGGVHFAGLHVASKSYERAASALHLLGAGLFIAGIGLIAQTFNLHSQKGEAFLIWAAMIAPLAILLRNGPIALLSIVALTIWGNIYMGYLLPSRGWLTICAFNASICVSSSLAGLLLKQKGSQIASYLQTPGMIGLVSWLYFFGFAHNFGYRPFSEGNALIPILTLIPGFIAGAFLWVRNQGSADTRYFLIAIGCAISTIILILAATSIGVDQYAYFEHFSFGWTKKIYLLPLLISVSAWVAYFGLAFWGVIYGALNHKRWMLNCNVFLIGLGIFTRFIDLMGSMMDTGIMFIICGLLLLGIGFVLEKWRRKLIAKAKI